MCQNIEIRNIYFSDEEETHLRDSIFELVKILLSFNLNESEIALYSALILIRPGKENVIYPH
jgi:hypothetical protein